MSRFWGVGTGGMLGYHLVLHTRDLVSKRRYVFNPGGTLKLDQRFQTGAAITTITDRIPASAG